MNRLSARLFVLAMVLCTAHGQASTADAAVVIGGTERVVSDVQGFLGPVTRVLQVQDEIFSEEVIDTGDDGATRIVFLDSTALVMGPNSRVTLDRFVFDPRSGDGSMVVNFVSGVFEFASGLIPSGGYDLRTPFANLAIRGTLVRLSVNRPQQRVLVTVPQGEVAMSDGSRTVVLGNEQECIVWQVQQGALLPVDACSSLTDDIAATFALLTAAAQIEPGAGPTPAPLLLLPPPVMERTGVPPLQPVSPSSGQSIR
jgi:hypothetical protein